MNDKCVHSLCLDRRSCSHVGLTNDVRRTNDEGEAHWRSAQGCFVGSTKSNVPWVNPQFFNIRTQGTRGTRIQDSMV